MLVFGGTSGFSLEHGYTHHGQVNLFNFETSEWTTLKTEGDLSPPGNESHGSLLVNDCAYCFADAPEIRPLTELQSLSFGEVVTQSTLTKNCLYLILCPSGGVECPKVATDRRLGAACAPRWSRWMTQCAELLSSEDTDRAFFGEPMTRRSSKNIETCLVVFNCGP
jgi:hypothetical protein